MNEDLLWLAAGAVLTHLGVLIGAWRQRRRTPDPAATPTALCGCSHPLAMHDPDTNACHATVKVASRWNKYGDAVGWERPQCTCRQYTGPRPIDQVFAPRVLPPTDT